MTKSSDQLSQSDTRIHKVAARWLRDLEQSLSILLGSVAVQP